MPLKRLFRAASAALALVGAAPAVQAQGSKVPEHALIVHFMYGSKDLSRLFALEDRLETAIKNSNAGEYDGHEVNVDGSDGFLYMYGPNADRLLNVVEPILKSTDFMRGAKATKRYGPPGPGVKEATFVIAQ